MSSYNLKQQVTLAINEAYWTKQLPSDVRSLIVEYLEIAHIFFCSHQGINIVAYNIHGDCLGTIINAPGDNQWVTGFDFDSHGALYVAMYDGLLAKYAMPLQSASPWSMQVVARDRNQTFQRKINTLQAGHQLQDSAPEGVVVIENADYHSVFVTCMDPINGVLQLSLSGDLQRIICPNILHGLWSMKRVPSYFTQNVQSSFIQKRSLLMAAQNNRLRVIDIDMGETGQVMVDLTFPSRIGDFTFCQPMNECGKALLLVTLKNGTFQIHQGEMFWMLSRINLNSMSKSLRLREAYGTAVGPDGNVYFCDHKRDRIVKISLLGRAYETPVVTTDNRQELKHAVFVRGVTSPNYSKWVDAAQIGLNFVNFEM